MSQEIRYHVHKYGNTHTIVLIIWQFLLWVGCCSRIWILLCSNSQMYRLMYVVVAALWDVQGLSQFSFWCNGMGYHQVEDMIDTGTTLAKLVKHISSKGAASVSVCVMVDKASRRVVPLKLSGMGKCYVGFEVRSSSAPSVVFEGIDGFNLMHHQFTCKCMCLCICLIGVCAQHRRELLYTI